MTSARVVFRVLGPVRAEVDGRVVRPGRRRERLLLGLLLLEAGRTLSSEWLGEVICQDSGSPCWRPALHTAVSRLRGALTSVGGAHIVTTEIGYGIEVDSDAVDAHRFRLLVDAARSTPDPAVRSVQLRGALRLWRGPVLADAASDELRQRVGYQITALRDRAHRLCIEAEMEAGQHLDLLGELTELTAAHPLDEAFAGYLMLAQHRAGMRGDALRTFRTTRSRLVEELGVEPSPSLLELHRAMLRDESIIANPWMSPSSIMTQPAALPVPAQLPATASKFTGRAQYLSQLDDHIVNDPLPPAAGRTVILSGIGGVGKTALALTWAHHVRLRFPDGQLYVDLRGHTQAHVQSIDALASLLRTLGVPGDRIPIETDEAAALYRTQVAERRLLIVLDNAANADQVRPLLPGTAASLVIITSRTKLMGLATTHGASQIPVEPLTRTECLTLLAKLIGRKRVDDESTAAAQLVELCGHLPLAVRIIAANLAGNPRQSLISCVSALGRDPLGTLMVLGDTSIAMRTVLDQSYACLAPSQQRMFRLLAVCPGHTIGADTASALAATSNVEAQRMLAQLADYSIVEQLGHERFGWHDLVHAYACERVRTDETSAERDAATSRLFDRYTSVATAAADLLDPHRIPLPASPAPADPPVYFHDRGEALAWLDIELPNLVACAQHAATNGPHPAAWALADALRGYFWQRRLSVEWRTVAQAGLYAARVEHDIRASAASHRSLANACMSQARYDEAIEHYSASLTLSREACWYDSQRIAQAGLASAHRELGQLDVAASLLRDSLFEARDHAQPAALARLLNKLGLVYVESGNPAAAMACLREALAIDTDIGSNRSLSEGHNNLALALHMLGDLEAALCHVTTARTLSRRLEDRVGEANKLDTLASVHRDLRSYSQALDFAQQALALAVELDDQRIQAHALNTLATVQRRLGNDRESINLHQRSLELALITKTFLARIASLIGLSGVEPHPSKRAATAYEALELSRQGGFRMLEGQALAAVTRVHLADGDARRAIASARKAVAIHRIGQHRLCEFEAAAILRAAGSSAAKNTSLAATAV